jgi:large subunit ribosomal protein L23
VAPVSGKEGKKEAGPEKPGIVKSAKKTRIERKDRKEARVKKESPKKPEKARKIVKKEDSIAHKILIEPFITEKSTSLGQFNKYVFKVDRKAGKNQIKEAIQDYYGVEVTKVNVIKIHPKKRIHGRTIGWKKGFKKAVVTLKEGDLIGVADGV